MVNSFLMYKTALYEHVYVMCMYNMKTDIYFFFCFDLPMSVRAGEGGEEESRGRDASSTKDTRF